MIISSQAVGKPPDDPDLRVRLRKDLRVTNPDYVAQVRFGNKFAPKPPQYLYGYSYDEEADTITIPRDYYIQNLYRPEDKIKTVSVQGKYPEPRMEMFDYQEEASDAFFALVNQNDEKGLPTDATVVMATSSGKSFLGMFCAYHSNERCLVVVPTQEIEAAWIEDCCKVFKMSPKDIGRIRATKFSIGDAFTIGSIQTLMNRDPKTWAPHFGITVFDECLLEDTLVEGTRIQDLRVGSVLSTGVVSAIESFEVDTLVRVTTDSGRVVISTPGHPFYSPGAGWKPAIELYCGCTMLCTGDQYEDTINSLPGMREEDHGSQIRGNSLPMGDRREWKERGESTLLKSVQGGDREGTAGEVWEITSEVQQGARLRANEDEEPHVGPRSKKASQRQQGEDWIRQPAECQRGKRAEDPITSGDTIFISGGEVPEPWVGPGVSSRDWEGRKRAWFSHLLQGGHRVLGKDDLYRGRRKLPQWSEASFARSEEGSFLVGERVARVEVIKRGSPEFSECGGGEGRVFDLTIAGSGVFWSNGVLSHNCHRCPAQRFLEVAENCRSHLRLGLTATDIRRDGMMPAIRWHLGQNVYKDTTPKNSVPLVYHAISTDISVTPTRIFQGEVEYEWNDVLSKICADMDYATLIMQIYEKTQLIGGAVLITTCRKDHIEVLTQRFRYRYGKAWVEENIAIVTGQTKKRRELLQEIKDGKWKITIAVQSIMSEGASVPKWRHVIVGTPFNDPKTAIQIKGRPIRKDPSDPTKTDGHMWDIAVNIQMCRNMARNRARALASHTSVTKVYRHAPGTDIILQRES